MRIAIELNGGLIEAVYADGKGVEIVAFEDMQTVEETYDNGRVVTVALGGEEREHWYGRLRPIVRGEWVERLFDAIESHEDNENEERWLRAQEAARQNGANAPQEIRHRQEQARRLK